MFPKNILPQNTNNLYHSLVPGPPRSIKVVVSAQDAVVVSWLPPDQPNGVIVQYNLYVRSVGVNMNTGGADQSSET